MPPAFAPPASASHFPALDGLRAVAVLLVLYDHAPQVLGRDRGTMHWLWHGSAGAWIGVDLFFVLSGFLITTILLRARGQDGAFRRFWLRRALRIFPLAAFYLVALAACALVLPGFEHLREPAQFGFAVTYTTNVHVAWFGWSAAAFGILWSLSVEEHFYLGWPLLALRMARRALVGLLLAVVVGVPCLRACLLPEVGPVHVYVATWCRCDTLAWGSLLALAFDSPWRDLVLRAGRWLWLPGTAWLAFVLGRPFAAVGPGTPPWFFVVGYSAIAVAFASWCAVAIEPPRGARWLGHQSLARIGRISYGLYVWHVLAAEFTTGLLGWAGVATTLETRTVVWLVVLAMGASASHRWLEAPCLRLKDRIGGAAGTRRW